MTAQECLDLAEEDVSSGTLAGEAFVRSLRSREFSRLRNCTYADYAGCPPYSEALLRQATEELCAQVAPNPHSSAGEAESAAADRLRELTAELCGTSLREYAVVLTSGATDSLRLVGDLVPWTPASRFLYHYDNHTSVLGVGACAVAAGGRSRAVEVRVESEAGSARNRCSIVALDPASGEPREDASGECCAGKSHRSPPSCAPACSLFALSAESNFSGVRYDVDILRAIKDADLQAEASTTPSKDSASLSMSLNVASLSRAAGYGDSPTASGTRWLTLLDAARACGSSPPAVGGALGPDFLCLSYYKVFGWPTGLGALLLRRSALDTPLRRPTHVGGGAVAGVLPFSGSLDPLPLPAGLESGSGHFLGARQALLGFAWLAALHRDLRLGCGVDPHALPLLVAARCAAGLRSMRHGSGAPVCRVHGAWALSKDLSALERQGGAGRGPVVAFSVLSANGQDVGHVRVERLARWANLHLRGGQLCNLGACCRALGMDQAFLRRAREAGGGCGGAVDLVEGRATGVVRASFGYASTLADADAVVSFVRDYFVDVGERQEEGGGRGLGEEGGLEPSPSRGEATPRQARYVSGDENASCNPWHEPVPPPCLAQTTWSVQALYVYPLKSCAGFQVTSWPLTSSGLLLDRAWVIWDDASDAVLKPRRCPELVRLHPHIDLDRCALRLELAGQTELGPMAVTFDVEEPSALGHGVDVWLSRALGRLVSLRPASETLRRARPAPARVGGKGDSEAVEETSGRGFAAGPTDHSLARAAFPPMAEPSSRPGDLLIVGRPSLSLLAERLRGADQPHALAEEALVARFRPNVVVAPSTLQQGASSRLAHAEDTWRHVRWGGFRLRSLGACARCERVCLSERSGRAEGTRLLLALAAYRRAQGRVCFGALCDVEDGACGTVGVGDDLQPS